MKSRLILMSLLVGIMVLFGFSNIAFSIDYPTRPIEYVIPVGGGGGSMTFGARVVIQSASELLGRPIFISYKPGAATTVGAEYVAKKAKPDGYTLYLINSGANGLALAVRPNLRYTNDDFELICQYGEQSMVLTVRSDSPWKSVKDVVDYAKKHPHELKCSTFGVGSSDHLILQLFNIEAGGLKIDSVPFQTGGEETMALAGGHTQIYFGNPVEIKGLVQAGKLRMLAVCDPERFWDLPEIPTMREEGFPGVTLGMWFGVGTARGVPKEILDKLRDAFEKTVKNPDIQAMLKNVGYTPRYRNPEEFRRFMNGMQTIYQRLAKQANIRVE